MLYLVTGGCGSGKSEYAEELVCRLARRDGIAGKLYLATMESDGREAAERIARHRRLRQGKGFMTAESPYGFRDSRLPALCPRGKQEDTIVLLECMSNLLANLMFSGGMDAGAAAEEILARTEEARKCYRHIVVVTNEIFSDGSRYTGETEAYCRALGWVNRFLAENADVFCEVIYSIPVFLKGETACRF